MPLLERKEHGCVQGRGISQDIGAFYRLDEYAGTVGPHTAAIRPTHPVGGEAHTLAMLDYSIVHNGEISSL